MTVSSQVNMVTYRGNGATTNFGFPFRVLEEADLVITLQDYTTGAVTKTYVPGEYTVTSLPADSGTVTILGTPITSDYRLVIERVVAFNQETDIVNPGGFYPDVVEAEFDHKEMEIQQLNNKFTRGVLVPKGETGFTISAAASRAGKFFGFDAVGNFVELTGTGVDDGLRTDLAADATGTLLIKHKLGLSGTFGRTLRQAGDMGMLGPALSLLHWVDPDYDEAIRDGTMTDDMVASLEAGLAYANEYGRIDLPAGLYPVASRVDATLLDNVLFTGKGKLFGLASSNADYLIDFSNTTEVTVEGLEFDANGANRTGTTTTGLGCVLATGSTGFIARKLICRNVRGYVDGGAVNRSWIAMTISGDALHPLVDSCEFYDCGEGPNTKPADAIFMRANFGRITNCYAERVTDHCYVLEGCNNSAVLNCAGKDVTSLGGISCAGAVNKEGNIIDGLWGTVAYFGSGGGTVGLYTFSTGLLKHSTIRNVWITANSDALGNGPAVYIGGAIGGDPGVHDNVIVENVNVDANGTSGKITHGVSIQGCSDVTLRRNHFAMDSVGTGIRIGSGSTGLRLRQNRVKDCSTGIYADGAVAYTFIEEDTEFNNCATAITTAGSAAYRGTQPQTFVPVFSSDVGNSAASFDSAPTVTQARISRRNSTIFLSMNVSLQVKAATTLAYIDVLLPTWAEPANQDQYRTGGLIYNTGAEQFQLRPISSNKLRIYRALGAGTNFAAGTPVNFSFETQWEAA